MISYRQFKTKSSSITRHFNKDMLLILTGNLITILINIAIVKLLTNKLSTTDFGFYSLITSFSTLPQLVFYAPIASAIFPFIKNKKNENNYGGLQNDVFDLILMAVITFFSILIIILLSNFFLHFIANYILYLCILGFAFSTTLSFLSTLDTFSLANSRVKEYTIFPIINLLLKLILIGLMFKNELNVYTILLYFSVIQFLFVFVEYYFLRKIKILTIPIRFKLERIIKLNTQTKIEILKYGNNFFLWGIFGWAQSFLDKLILSNYMGTSPVAIYSVYYQYGFFPFTIFSTIISQYITPLFFTHVDNDMSSFSFLKKLLLYSVTSIIIISPILCTLSYYLAPLFIKMLTNSNYLEYIKLFPIIVLAGILYGYGQIITIPLLNSDFVKKIRLPKIGAVIIAVALFFILIPRYQLLGILCALLISNLFYFFSLILINLRYFKFLKNKLSVS